VEKSELTLMTSMLKKVKTELEIRKSNLENKVKNCE
jgi:hypothetical protein